MDKLQGVLLKREYRGEVLGNGMTNLPLIRGIGIRQASSTVYCCEYSGLLTDENMSLVAIGALYVDIILTYALDLHSLGSES